MDTLKTKPDVAYQLHYVHCTLASDTAEESRFSPAAA